MEPLEERLEKWKNNPNSKVGDKEFINLLEEALKRYNHRRIRKLWGMILYCLLALASIGFFLYYFGSN